MLVNLQKVDILLYNTINMRKPKTTEKMPLHQFIATGGKPKDFVSCKGVSSETVNNIKRNKK